VPPGSPQVKGTAPADRHYQADVVITSAIASTAPRATCEQMRKAPRSRRHRAGRPCYEISYAADGPALEGAGLG
jgi:hypothetical protein